MEFIVDKTIARANDIIELSIKDNVYLPKTKLQKLLYFLYGHYLAKAGEQLFDDMFCVFPYGPVLPRILHETNNMSNIKDFIEDADGEVYIADLENAGSVEYKKILLHVWNKYSHFSSSDLTALSHAPGSPWDLTKIEYGMGSEIDPDIIRRYFLGEVI